MSLFQKQKQRNKTDFFTLKEVVQSTVKGLYSREIFRLYPKPMESPNHSKAIPTKVPKIQEEIKVFQTKRRQFMQLKNIKLVTDFVSKIREGRTQ